MDCILTWGFSLGQNWLGEPESPITENTPADVEKTDADV